MHKKHEGKDLSWEDALKEYSRNLERKYEDKRITFSIMDTAIKTLEKHTKHWNKKWLSDFTSEMIEGFIGSEQLQKEIESPTRANLLKFIRGVFKLMVHKGRMKHNPAMGIYLRGRKKRAYPIVMKHNEIVSLIKYTKEVNPQWAEVYTVAFLTGARSGELYSLKRKNVDWDNKNIHITHSDDWKTETHQEMTKGKKDRTVPINSALLKCLMELRGKYGDFVLPRIRDWKNGRAAEILRAHQKAIGIRQTKFHGIRGTFITNLLLQNVPLIKVQAIVGHDDLKTTLMYVGMLAEETRGATEGQQRGYH